MWKTGGYTGFSNKISELTSNGTRLTVSAPYDLLLLAGKSARAFEGRETSGAGIVPVIQLKGSDGSEIHIQWARGTPGQELLVLPLSFTGDTQISRGTLAAEVQAFGALAWAEDDGFGARITQALGNNSADSYVFNGGVTAIADAAGRRWAEQRPSRQGSIVREGNAACAEYPVSLLTERR
ncbi:hypothetical protein QP583_16875 [Escherichia coli]|nr:hypothetical protein [Escherichia coli]